MPYVLTFEIHDLPKMANISSGKSHWRYAHQEAAKWKKLVGMAVAGREPDMPLTHAKLILTRFSSSAPDYDGLVRGFKSVVDGLREAGVLENDRLSNTGAWDCRWQKAPMKHGKIRVEVRGE